MTSSHPWLPGLALLRLARRLFSPDTLRSIVEPAIADFQHEVHHARGAAHYVLACLRGYLSIWALLLVVPFAREARSVRPARTALGIADPPDGVTLAIVTALCLPLAVILYTVFGVLAFIILTAGIGAALALRAWHNHQADAVRRAPGDPLEVRLSVIAAPEQTAGVLVVAGWIVLFVASWIPWLGVALAAAAAITGVAVHDWHARHPAQVAFHRHGAPRHPEINFASIQVMENMAGLLVVIGSVAIIAAGLPAFRAFLLATILAGVAVAASLGGWRLTHPARLTAENSIAPR